MVLHFLFFLTWFGLANPQWNCKVSDCEAMAFTSRKKLSWMEIRRMSKSYNALAVVLAASF